MTKSAELFKRSVLVTLPKSGLEVELRQPDPGRLLAQKVKDIPALLTPIVSQQISGEVDAETFNREVSQPTVENIGFMTAFQDMIVSASFVWPKVVSGKEPNYAAGEIVLEDLETEDRVFVFNWAMPKAEEVEAAKSFRNGTGESVEPSPDGEIVLTTTE